jgi:hypothetical protein
MDSWSKFEVPVAGSAWITSVEQGAGIYFLEGRTHVAGHDTPAERTLQARGALLVALIRFDRDLHESALLDRVVEPLGAYQAARKFPSPSLLS